MRAAVILVCAAMMACHAPAKDSAATVVRLAIHRDAVMFMPIHAAQTLGYFRQQGIDVELWELSAGAKAIEALLGGSVDVAAGSMSDVVALAAEGRAVRGFLVLYDRPTVALAVAPTSRTAIRTVHDLKGKPVGVSAPGSASHQILNALLVTNGLAPEDVGAVGVGMSATSIAALEHGTVEAAVLIGSAVAAYEERHGTDGFLVDTRTSAGAERVFGAEEFPSLSLLADGRWLEQHDDAARRLVRGVKEGMRWMQAQSAEHIRDMIPRDARMPSAEADIRSIRATQAVLSKNGVMPPESAARVARFVAISDSRVRVSQLDLTRLYTNRFADMP